MCYKKPGPRCSYHARQKMDKAKAHYLNTKKEQDSMPNPNKTSRLFLGEDNREELLIAAQEAYQKKNFETIRAMQEYKKAAAEFLETPEGIEKMENQLSETTDPIESGDLKRRIETAQTKRNAQLKMYNEIYNKAGDLKILPEGMKKEELVGILSKSTTPEGSHMRLDESEKLRKAHLIIQNRIDKLVSYFLNNNDEYYAPVGMVEEVGKMNAFPGFKFLAAGSYRAAFLDEKTGYVLKIPVDDRISKNGLRSESEDFTAMEQYGYSELDFQSMRNENIEYAQTFFYNASEFPKLPVVVQQYLNDDEYEEPDNISDEYFATIEEAHAP